MATKLYFHNTTIALGTLPTTEQSSLAPDANLFTNEVITTNRWMDTTIGTAQATLTNASTADTNAHNYYIARWVSPLLNQTSVAANTWNYKFAASESNAAANFPRNGAGALRIVCYVWKPSDGTKYGNILDGNSAADFEEAGTTQTIIEGTFSGAAVNSLTPGDAVIVFEAWAIVTQGGATSRTQNYFYDGTTESSSTNNAAHIETPEDITFLGYGPFNGTSDFISVPDSAALDLIQFSVACWFRTSDTSSTERMLVCKGGLGSDTAGQNNNYSIWFHSDAHAKGGFEEGSGSDHNTTSPLTYNDGVWHHACVTYDQVTVRLYMDGVEVDTNETTTSPENNVHPVVIGRNSRVSDRFFNADIDEVYVWNNDLTSGEVAALHSAGTIPQTGAIVYTNIFGAAGGHITSTAYERALDAETVTISESAFTRLYGANRAIATQTTTVGESLARMTVAQRALSTETVTSGENLARLYGANRALTTETTLSSENLARMTAATRALPETTLISENLARLLAANRTLTTETTTIADQLLREFGLVRSLATETVTNSEDLQRILAAVRSLPETTVIGETLNRMVAAIRALGDTTVISDSVSYIKTLIRTLATETVEIGENLARMLSANRSLSTESNSIGESLNRILSIFRTLPETVEISDSLTILKTIVRTLATETTSIGESLARIFGANRPLSTETVTVDDDLQRMLAAVRTSQDTTVIDEALARVVAVNRTLSTETTNITDDLQRMLTAIRSILEDTEIDESLNRTVAANRSLSTESTTIDDTLNKMLTLVRSLQDTTEISESLNRLLAISRTLPETVEISDQLERMLAAIRTLSTETITIQDILDYELTVGGGATNYNRSLDTEVVAISESLLRMIAANRALEESTAITEQLARMLSANRSLNENESISESLLRVLGSIRLLSETTPLTDSLNRLVTMTRPLTETINSNETLNRLVGITRGLTDTIDITDNLGNILSRVRALVESVSISDSIQRVFDGTRTLVETKSISDSVVYVWTTLASILAAAVENIVDRRTDKIEGVRTRGRDRRIAAFGRFFSRRQSGGRTEAVKRERRR